MLDTARKELNIPHSQTLKVYFQDEGRFGRMSNPVSCWAPWGIRPKLPLQRVREYTYVYAAVCPEDGDVFSLLLPYADTDVMQIFMTEFAKHMNDQPALMIMDQASWHKSKIECSRENKSGISAAIQPGIASCRTPLGTYQGKIYFKSLLEQYE